jgi:hypothetical protein
MIDGFYFVLLLRLMKKNVLYLDNIKILNNKLGESLNSLVGLYNDKVKSVFNSCGSHCCLDITYTIVEGKSKITGKAPVSTTSNL